MSIATLMENKKLVLNVEELAELLGISKPVAYELTRKSGFPAVRVSERRIIIPVDGLCRWLEVEAASGARV